MYCVSLIDQFFAQVFNFEIWHDSTSYRGIWHNCWSFSMDWRGRPRWKYVVCLFLVHHCIFHWSEPCSLKHLQHYAAITANADDWTAWEWSSSNQEAGNCDVWFSANVTRFDFRCTGCIGTYPSRSNCFPQRAHENDGLASTSPDGPNDGWNG